MQRKAAAALVAALVLALAGCGGTETTTVGRAEAVKRLEAACLAGTQAGSEVARKGHSAATFARAYQANLQTVLDKLDHVEASGAAKADFDAYKETVRTRVEAFERILAAGADQQTISTQRPRIDAAGRTAFAAIRRLHARHVCI